MNGNNLFVIFIYSWVGEGTCGIYITWYLWHMHSYLLYIWIWVWVFIESFFIYIYSIINKLFFLQNMNSIFIFVDNFILGLFCSIFQNHNHLEQSLIFCFFHELLPINIEEVLFLLGLIWNSCWLPFTNLTVCFFIKTLF